VWFCVFVFLLLRCVYFYAIFIKGFVCEKNVFCDLILLCFCLVIF
jgi:hypothetical protein